MVTEALLILLSSLTTFGVLYPSDVCGQSSPTELKNIRF